MPGGTGCSARYPGGWLIGHRSSVVQQAADDVAEHAAAFTLRVAARALGDRRMEVGALESDPSGPREPGEHQIATAAAQKPGLESIDLLGHLHGVVAVHPASRLDVDRLARIELLLEHVAVAVH